MRRVVERRVVTVVERRVVERRSVVSVAERSYPYNDGTAQVWPRCKRPKVTEEG